MDYGTLVQLFVGILAVFFAGWASGTFWAKGTLIPDTIEFDTEAQFIEWQHSAMLRTIIANNAMCDDGYAINQDPERIYGLAGEIRKRAREGETFWTHAAEARAVDATISWCARWLGILQSPVVTTKWVDLMEKAHAEASLN